jgi:hypothetical protein
MTRVGIDTANIVPSVEETHGLYGKKLVTPVKLVGTRGSFRSDQRAEFWA